MRIGLLTTSFPRFDHDVPGQFVLGFARALAARGHALQILAPEPAERRAPPAFPGVGVRWVRYAWPRACQRTFYGAGVPDNLRRDPLAWPGLLTYPAALLAAAQRELVDMDALVSHWALPCALTAGTVRGGRPHLAVLHSADVHLLSRLPARARLCTAILHGASQLLFVSAASRERFLTWLPETERERARTASCVQPMGIDPAPDDAPDRERLRRELGLTRFTLLSLARLVPIKGLCEAVSALAHRADLEWLIAGEGPLAPDLAALASRSRLRVRLLGRVGGSQKRALLQACDAFVLPSRVLPSGRSEGAPIALLEAMAHGLPAVASNAGGVPELISPQQTGLLWSPADGNGLERAIDALIAQPSLRIELTERARSFARQHQWGAIGPRLETWLQPERAAPTSERAARLPALGS